MQSHAAACAGRKLAYLALETPGGALLGDATADELMGALHPFFCHRACMRTHRPLKGASAACTNT